jgi:3alpha(or 20beta)-hydroxysteroid dehydrogenase
MTISSNSEQAGLDGRVVLVTGAARGQGRAIAERAVRAGAYVIAGDVLPSVADLALEMDDSVFAARLDVTDAHSWQRLVADGLDRFGRLDALVNNAGVLRRSPIEEESAAEFERTWRVNCLGAFLGIQATLTHLRVSPSAVVLNTLSTAALTGWTSHGAYGSSKWALRGLTKVAALELAPYGIRVNAIVPGPVLTPMVVQDGDPLATVRLSHTPLGRAGLPSDIADLAMFLLSDHSGFITGAEIVIDGGQVAGTISSTSDGSES